MKLTELKLVSPVTVKGALYHYIHAEKRRFSVFFDSEKGVVHISDDKGDLTLTPFTNVVWCKVELEAPKKK